MIRSLTLFAIALFISLPSVASEHADSVSNVCDGLLLKQSIAGAGIGIVVNASVTEILKHSIHEMRPDRSDNRSFPSRHTSYAFTVASIASHQLCHYSPFWTTAAHTVANVVGMQRVLSQHHYPGDVLAGASIGIISSEIGYMLSRLVFGDRGLPTVAMAENMPGIYSETKALIMTSGHKSGTALGCGIESSLRVSLPTSDYFGLGLAARMRSHPVFYHNNFSGMLNGFAITADSYAYTSLGDGRWAAEGRLSCGIMRYFDRPLQVAAPWSYLVDISAGLSRKLTERLSVGASIGCDLASRPQSDAALAISLYAKALF